ncbi:GDP-L-fucose synthase [Pelagibacterales bacterium SAG-MED06]|nr:GDP-L-fucose synthase [Pelagibacterales bacterium SAG-MED06]
MNKPRVFIAGHKGMVGSALIRVLKNKNIKIIVKEKKDLNLLNQDQVQNFFKHNKIDQVYIAAAKVGGIHANMTYPAEFIYENLMIVTNIIHSAFLSDVKKLLFLGSSCIYPKFANQPISEQELLSGKLESSNEPYAIAKIAGIKLCESYNRQYHQSHGIDYRTVMPTNLYGPGDNYHPENSHVIPALISRFHYAKLKKLPKIFIWGTGKPRREFLHVDDMAKASVYLMNIDKVNYDKYITPMCSHINVGSGKDISIQELAEIIKKVVGYNGEINFDSTKPDGIPRKFMNSKLINSMGWKSEITLKKGLVETYNNFKKYNANS